MSDKLELRESVPYDAGDTPEPTEIANPCPKCGPKVGLIGVTKMHPAKGRAYFHYCMKCHYTKVVQIDENWSPLETDAKSIEEYKRRMASQDEMVQPIGIPKYDLILLETRPGTKVSFSAEPENGLVGIRTINAVSDDFLREVFWKTWDDLVKRILEEDSEKESLDGKPANL